MTTGRINQVAFLRDSATRTPPVVRETGGRVGRRGHPYRAQSARTGPSQGRRAPAQATRSASESTGGRPWANTAEARSTGTRAPRLGSPRAPEEARGEEGQLRIRIPPQRVRNTGTHTRRNAPRARGPNMMGTAGRQFGAPARSLPTQTARQPLMRHRVHATSIPTGEPRPKRAVETPERDRARTARRQRYRGDEKARGTSSGRACLPRQGRDDQAAAVGLSYHATRIPQGVHAATQARRFNATQANE